MAVIPRLIHQTWKTHSVPEHWKESQESWQNLEKHGWTYQLWDDSDIRQLIVDEYPWFLEKFDSYPKGINRADAWRPFVLHKHGGVYVDLDIVAKPTEFLAFYELIKHHQVVLPHTKNGNGVGKQNVSNCFMMSQPQAEFWQHVWKRLDTPYKNRPFKATMAFLTPYFRTLFSTGPGVICDALATYKDRSQIYIAPAALVQPGDDRHPKPHDGTESVVRVIEGSSWHPKDAKFWLGLKWFQTHQQAILGTIIGILTAVIIGLSVWVGLLRKT